MKIYFVASKNQIGIVVDDETFEEIERLAKTYKLSRAAIVQELLIYLPLWEELRRKKDEILNNQIETILGKDRAVIQPQSRPKKTRRQTD